jgi:hypothetical protein
MTKLQIAPGRFRGRMLRWGADRLQARRRLALIPVRPSGRPEVLSATAIVVVPVIEVEQVEQIANSRHVAWHVGIVVILHRIG